MFGWFKNLFTNLGNGQGWQQTTPTTSLNENATVKSVDCSLQIGTVWQCVDLIARTFATLPIDVLQEDSMGRNIADKRCNLYKVLAQSPNKHQTPYEFWHQMCVSRILRGNAYAKIVRNGVGQVIALEPLNADQVNVEVNANGEIEYYYTIDSKRYIYDSDDILHWKGLGNGYVGLSVLEYMQSVVTETAEAQENAINLYRNKGKLPGILTADNILNDLQKKEISKAFQAMRENNGIPVLPANLRFQQLALSPADTQLLETRKFTSAEICKWFGVPKSMLDGESTTIDIVARHFYKTTVLPLCISAEQTIMQKIPCGQERFNHVVKFRLSILNRASDSERAQLNATYVQNGIKSRNEVRREEGWIDVAGGDLLTAQTNLAPLESLGQFDTSQVSQTPLRTEPIKQSVRMTEVIRND